MEKRRRRLFVTRPFSREQIFFFFTIQFNSLNFEFCVKEPQMYNLATYYIIVIEYWISVHMKYLYLNDVWIDIV